MDKNILNIYYMFDKQKYNKEYYEEMKEKILLDRQDDFYCDVCKLYVSKNYKNKHLKTRKHTHNLEHNILLNNELIRLLKEVLKKLESH